MSTILKRTILISLLGHLTLFSLFTFSFGTRFDTDYEGFYFWGTFLPASNPFSPAASEDNFLHRILNYTYNTTLKKRGDSVSLPAVYLRPQFFTGPDGEKITWLPRPESAYLLRARREPVMMLYPRLPYDFSLYFRDRQAAHIELAFNIKTAGNREEVAIKRKISSGNLEADLLSMRYISHYLFIQKTRFAPGVWQSVKIDLAARDDNY